MRAAGVRVNCVCVCKQFLHLRLQLQKGRLHAGLQKERKSFISVEAHKHRAVRPVSLSELCDHTGSDAHTHTHAHIQDEIRSITSSPQLLSFVYYVFSHTNTPKHCLILIRALLYMHIFMHAQKHACSQTDLLM